MQNLNQIKLEDENMTATSDVVVLKKLEKEHDRIVGGIEVTSDNDAGFRLARAEVLSIGEKIKDSGINIGDIVLYDEYAVFNRTYPVCWVRVENVIVIENNQNETGFDAIGDTCVFLQNMGERDETDGGIIIGDNSNKPKNWSTLIQYGNQCSITDIIPIGGKAMFFTDETQIEFKFKETSYIIAQSDRVVINCTHKNKTK